MTPIDSARLANQALRLALPKGGLVFNLVSSYIDESGTHDGSPMIGAGGYVFEADKAIAFNTEMGALFDKYKIPFFHASEIMGGKFKEGGRGKFDHLDKDDRKVIARTFIDAVKEYSAFGFGANVRESDYNRAVQKYGVMPGAYAFLLFQCLILVRRWIDKSQFAGRVFFYIEDGAKEKIDAIRYLDDEVLNTPAKKELYRYYDRAFVRKDHSPAINAADLIIYRWYSHHANKDEAGYKPRADLKALVRPQDMVADWAEGNRLEELERVVREHVEALRELRG